MGSDRRQLPGPLRGRDRGRLIVRSAGSRLAHRLRPLRARSLLVASVGTAGLNGSAMLFRVVTTLVLTRLMGAAEYGAYAFALAWATVLSIPALLGLTPLVVRTVATGVMKNEWGIVRGLLRRVNQAVLVTSALIVAGGFGSGFVLRTFRPEVVDAFWLGLLLVPIISLASVRQAALQGIGRVVLGRMPESLLKPALLLALVGIVGAVTTLSGMSAIGLEVATSAIAFAVGLGVLRRNLPLDAKASAPVYETRQWARSAIPLLVISGASTLRDQIDVILLGAIKGPRAAGIFSLADRIALTVSFFLLVASYPISPVIARLFAAGRQSELQRVVIRTSRVVFALALPVALVFVVFGRELLGVFGAEFRQGWVPLVVLSAGQLVNAGTGVVGIVLLMSGHERDVSRAAIVGTLTTVVLNGLLIPPFGIEGAAAGTASGLAFLMLMLTWLTWRRTGIWALAVGRPPRRTTA